ncbi:hypothetical protein EC988_005924 [Linderina pennispora]|nr:hypothetical protein EC988_005924 [Linderina pennispora]
MSTKTEDQILRDRMVVQERPLKRCLQEFSFLCEQSPKIPAPVAQQIASQVLREIRWFRHTVQCAVQVQRRSEQEISMYEQQGAQLEESIAEGRASVRRLGDELEESRNHKKHKIAYDEIAKEVEKRPTRAQLQQEIDEIKRETDQLQQEEQAHGNVIEAMQAQYANVLNEMHKLEDMAKDALTTQELGIFLGDADADVGKGEEGRPQSQSDMPSPAALDSRDAHRLNDTSDALMDAFADERRKSEGQMDGAPENEEDDEGSIAVDTGAVLEEEGEEGEEGEYEDEEGELSSEM